MKINWARLSCKAGAFLNVISVVSVVCTFLTFAILVNMRAPISGWYNYLLASFFYTAGFANTFKLLVMSRRLIFRTIGFNSNPKREMPV